MPYIIPFRNFEGENNTHRFKGTNRIRFNGYGIWLVQPAATKRLPVYFTLNVAGGENSKVDLLKNPG